MPGFRILPSDPCHCLLTNFSDITVLLNFSRFPVESSKAPTIPPEPKDLKCKHSNITNDKDLPGGVHKNNFTVVKEADTMAKCMEKCCDSKDCDLAYMVEKKCYSVSCSSKDDCRPVSVKASEKTPLISAMVMKVEPKEETGTRIQLCINYFNGRLDYEVDTVCSCGIFRSY